ncbi:MAG: helix-turn-helix transcriptional regulator [Polyangiales bacterium]
MEPSLEAAIDVVEAAYNLELSAGDWLPNVLSAGESLFDHGLGYYGIIGAGVTEEGVPIFTQALGSLGAEDLPMKVMRSAQEFDPDIVHRASADVQGRVYLLSDVCDRWPNVCESINRHLESKDLLSLTATDPDGCGVNISMPLPERGALERCEREFWQMLEVHLAAGHRLRRGLGQQGKVAGAPITEATLDAGALIDPSRFLVSHANGEAADRGASEKLREAARLVDKARGPLRKQDPKEALRLWEGLVRGKWSLVDWFDTDGRRFLVAKPNAPRIRDPRGLTEREAQVATYASLGETSKIIGYRLGLSPAYVSRLLHDAMRKLSVKTQAQLVEKMRTVDFKAPPAA